MITVEGSEVDSGKDLAIVQREGVWELGIH